MEGEELLKTGKLHLVNKYIYIFYESLPDYKNLDLSKEIQKRHWSCNGSQLILQNLMILKKELASWRLLNVQQMNGNRHDIDESLIQG